MTEDANTPKPGEPDKQDAPAPKKTFDNPSPAAPTGGGSPGKETPKPEADPSLLPGPASRTFGKPKKERRSSGLWGPLLFLFLLLAGGIGAGGFFLYQEQMKFQEETRAKLAQLQDQLTTMDTEADLTRKNQQSIDALNQELQQFKTQMSATVKAHQNSLTTLDEDVLRLKEKVEKVPAVPPAPEPMIGDDLATAPTDKIAPPPETRDEDNGEGPVEGQDKRSRDTQKFMEWMKNMFSAIWDWFTGLFN